MLRKFNLNPTLDMETMIWSNDGVVFLDDSTIMLWKGDPTAKAAEASQASFDTTLQNLMTAQYGKQSAITTYLTNQMQPRINAGGVGTPAAALAAERTSATDTLTTQYENARKAAAASENQSGLPSGVNAQVSGSLLSAEAQSKAAAQSDITAQNEARRQADYWNSINTLSGNAASLNPLGYANAATSGSGSVAGLSNAVTNANQSQLLGALGGLAGGVGGALTSHFLPKP